MVVLVLVGVFYHYLALPTIRCLIWQEEVHLRNVDSEEVDFRNLNVCSRLHIHHNLRNIVVLVHTNHQAGETLELAHQDNTQDRVLYFLHGARKRRLALEVPHTKEPDEKARSCKEELPL